jgi:hypothetical protein
MPLEPNSKDCRSSHRSLNLERDRRPAKYNFSAIERDLLRAARRLTDLYARDERRAA